MTYAQFALNHTAKVADVQERAERMLGLQVGQREIYDAHGPLDIELNVTRIPHDAWHDGFVRLSLQLCQRYRILPGARGVAGESRTEEGSDDSSMWSGRT